MLLVNSFTPIQKGYGNQNSNKNSFKQSQFQSKADSVSFTSSSARLTREADAQVREIAQRIEAEYSDVLGKNFKTKFLEPVEEFLRSHGSTIKLENIDSFSIFTNALPFRGGKVRNASKACLVDKAGSPIIGYMGIEARAEAITQNGAKARLFDSLISDIHSPFKNVKFPDELVLTSEKVNKALDETHKQWGDIKYPNNDLKATSLQYAFKKLMPEG